MAKKRILITGSNGLLGQKLVDLLLPNPDVELIATCHSENRLASVYPELAFHKMDVTNARDVAEVLGRYRPDHVIHTAAMTNVDLCETEREQCRLLNVEAVRYLVNACKEYDLHLVHLSTDHIFDGEAGPYDEEATPAPVNFYGQSKLDADLIVLESGIKYAIARTTLVYGTVHDGSRSNIVLWVKNSLEAGKSLRIVDDQLRSPTLAEDLAMGCWLLAKNNAQGIYNIAGPDLLTPYQMALKVADVFGLDKNLIERSDSSSLNQPANRPPRTGFILDKAHRDLGYEPHSFEEGILLVARQVQQNPAYQKA